MESGLWKTDLGQANWAYRLYIAPPIEQSQLLYGLLLEHPLMPVGFSFQKILISACLITLPLTGWTGEAWWLTPYNPRSTVGKAGG